MRHSGVGPHLPPPRLIACSGARALRVVYLVVMAVTLGLVWAWWAASQGGSHAPWGWEQGRGPGGIAPFAMVFGMVSACGLVLRGLRDCCDGILAWDGRGSWTLQAAGQASAQAGVPVVAMNLGDWILLAFVCDGPVVFGLRRERWTLACRGAMSTQDWSTARATLRWADPHPGGSALPWSA